MRPAGLVALSWSAGYPAAQFLDTHGLKAYCISQLQSPRRSVERPLYAANGWESHIVTLPRKVDEADRDGTQRGNLLSDCGVAMVTASATRPGRERRGSGRRG